MQNLTTLSLEKLTVSFSTWLFNFYISKLIDKGISTLPFDSIQLNLIGANGFKKQGFVNFKGDFTIFVDQPGIYKLEVFHRSYYFEPVIVEVNTDHDNVTRKKYAAFLFTL